MNKRLVDEVIDDLLDRIERESQSPADIILMILRSSPKPLATKDLYEILPEMGHSMSLRTIQRVIRDLISNEEIKFVGYRPRKNIIGRIQQTPVYEAVE